MWFDSLPLRFEGFGDKVKGGVGAEVCVKQGFGEIFFQKQTFSELDFPK